jgi:hypothetical protein
VIRGWRRDNGRITVEEGSTSLPNYRIFLTVGFLDHFKRRKVFAMQPNDLEMWQRSRSSGISNVCNCFLMSGHADVAGQSAVNFHAEKQNTTSDAWRTLEELVEKAASRNAKEFAPGMEMPQELWAQIVTLPPSISKLKRVKKLYLYGSYLVRIPPEIGGMTDLEELDIYSSYRLHWLPYEVTRCTRLKRSRASTRALYGNYKYRTPFPSLGAQDASSELPEACSVCREPLEVNSVQRCWISMRVAKDVLPLLVNACSEECVKSLPPAAKGYVDRPHKGGVELVQPNSEFIPPR